MSEIQCECGSMVLNMKTHIKTVKHKHNLIDIQRAKERKEYYDNHKTERNARVVELYHIMKKDEYTCPCGSTIRIGQKAIHIKTSRR